MNGDEEREASRNAAAQLRKRFYTLGNEMTQLPVFLIEGPTKPVPFDIEFATYACYSPNGLTYLSHFLKPPPTPEERRSGIERVRKQIEQLDADANIDEALHRAIMQKAQRWGASGHEVICGLLMGKSHAGENIVLLHAAPGFSKEEATRVLKQAALSK